MKSKPTPTVTNSPLDQIQFGGDHYLRMGIQPWDAMEKWMSAEAFEGFLRGSAIKYIARSDKKGNKIEDYKKARHNLDKLINFLESQKV